MLILFAEFFRSFQHDQIAFGKKLFHIWNIAAKVQRLHTVKDA